jgi:hypothetical protein
MKPTAAFWMDTDYGQAAASDGASRFRACLLSHVDDGALSACWDGRSTEDDDRAVEFCTTVWRLACAPVMAPGYVRWHPRVIAAVVRRSEWDGGLLASVKLVAPQPSPVLSSLTETAARPWFDRPVERLGHVVSFADPSAEDLVRRRYATCDLNLEFALELRAWPAAPEGPQDDVEFRARCVLAEIVNALSDAVDPVLAAIEGVL